MSAALMRNAARLLWALATAIWLPLLWALAMLPWPAHANVCAAYSATGPDTVDDAPADWDPLPCLPTWLRGTGKGYGQWANSSGVVGWLWCPAGSSWTLRFGAGTWADASAAAAEAPAALIAPDVLGALKALGEKYRTKRIDDPTLLPLWCPQWAAMVASRPADVVPGWYAAGGAMYSVVNGKRSSVVPGATAPKGAACNCATKILYTPIPGLTVTYCPLAAGPATQVTECRP